MIGVESIISIDTGLPSNPFTFYEIQSSTIRSERIPPKSVELGRKSITPVEQSLILIDLDLSILPTCQKQLIAISFRPLHVTYIQTDIYTCIHTDKIPLLLLYILYNRMLYTITILCFVVGNIGAYVLEAVSPRRYRRMSITWSS